MTLSETAFKGRPVVVLGGGVLGRRIACVWAAGGWNVIIRDPSEEQRIAALHYIENNLNNYAESIGSTAGEVTATEDLQEAVKDAWNIIEAVPENLALKTNTFADLERLAPSDALLASNSSSYKSSEMVGKVADETKRRIFNTHYMMPPEKKVIELMSCGLTDEDIFPFYSDCLKKVGLNPVKVRKQSSGFIFNRIWAAVKRESLSVISEGVSTPEEIDAIWSEMTGLQAGPCALMDAVGLDTVALIEEHYVAERGLSSEHTTDFLQKNFISKGKLGNKSDKGGFYPPGSANKAFTNTTHSHDGSLETSIYVLDLGINDSKDPYHAGKILLGSSDGRKLRTLVENQYIPDGLDVSTKTGRIYWTNMGVPGQQDGEVKSCKFDGSDIQTLLAKGTINTPKQLVVDQINDKLWFCDREGMRVMRCNLDGSEHETLVQAGDSQNPADVKDKTKLCVGISVNNTEGKFYWTQKGGSKGGEGRIYRANIEMPKGETASTRTDIDLLLKNLPEPIDLDIDEDTQTLFWSDRGDPPFGNSLNSIKLGEIKPLAAAEDKNPDYSIIARQLHEAIGIRVDTINKKIYTSDMGGTVWECSLDGQRKKRLYDLEGAAFSGLAIAHV